ncbi:metal-dependent transcriptional regulator [Phocicoccus pinnipedialis]|uniref:Manganese transport regulator n=1 Tax=Phocicoccus pinnipedialis TaxID=110845 RepID=A0A6V7RCM5_9BACL|nr:metal-dependent transcriptional regulator [Jeotgalicoccus pinnipedialis]MBP1939898.1 DtxR family Mn-dependent transcriptional regulator [Jeotgalicoccus pinnipedialis]CAD2074774.1 Iron-dependent repressor IdeR [Jeotgalicoccus pinnipedialis]
MSPTREDYLKIIYELGGRVTRVPNKEIAMKLNISPPTVTEMMHTLVSIGWIEYVPYRGSMLTEVGVEEAKKLIHKHRLWEVFLVEHLGYSLEDVHDEAEVLEHATSDTLANKLYHFLGKPDYCPHGGAISFNKIEEQDNEAIPLPEVGKGVRAQILRHVNEEKLLVYFKNHNLSLLDIIIVKEFDKSLDLLHIYNETNGEDVYISEKTSHYIFVKQVD